MGGRITVDGVTEISNAINAVYVTDGAFFVVPATATLTTIGAINGLYCYASSKCHLAGTAHLSATSVAATADSNSTLIIGGDFEATDFQAGAAYAERNSNI